MHFFAKKDSVVRRSLFALLLVTTLGLVLPTAPAQTGTEVTGTLDNDNHPLSLRPREEHQAELQVVPEGFSNAVIRPGYLLELNVVNVPEFTGIELRVSSDGNVTVPDVGSVHIAGETVPEAETALKTALVQGQVLVAPQLRLNILQYASDGVTVLGEVGSPGRLRLLAPTSLSDVLALAGGETVSSGNDIEIERPGQDGKAQTTHVRYSLEKHGDGGSPVMILPGDTVFVHRAGVIYVIGAVGKPGAYLMVNGGTLSVLQGVSLAGGTLLNAATRDIRILRPEGTQYRSIEVPYSKLLQGKSEAVQLQPNDILYVSHSRVKTVLLDGSYLLGTTLAGSLYRVP